MPLHVGVSLSVPIVWQRALYSGGPDTSPSCDGLCDGCKCRKKMCRKPEPEPVACCSLHLHLHLHLLRIACLLEMGDHPWTYPVCVNQTAEAARGPRPTTPTTPTTPIHGTNIACAITRSPARNPSPPCRVIALVGSTQNTPELQDLLPEQSAIVNEMKGAPHLSPVWEHIWGKE